MNRRTFFIFLGTIATLSLVGTVLASVGVGEITHRFEGAPECLLLDPEASEEPATKRKARPGDVYTIRQFITNTCENSIDIQVTLDTLQTDWIDVDSSDEGTFALSPGELFSATATITFGNDTPADFSAKDVVFKISRPE